MSFFKHKTALVEPEAALPGRPEPGYAVPAENVVLGTPQTAPAPEGYAEVWFGTGCFCPSGSSLRPDQGGTSSESNPISLWRRTVIVGDTGVGPVQASRRGVRRPSSPRYSRRR